MQKMQILFLRNLKTTTQAWKKHVEQLDLLEIIAPVKVCLRICFS